MKHSQHRQVTFLSLQSESLQIPPSRNQIAEGNYKIIFKLSHEVMDAKKAKKLIKQADERTFRISQKNYIDVPKNTDPSRVIYGGNIFDGSTGSIYDQAALFNFKVCAHEFGHLLGLGEMNDTSVPPTLMTQAGKPTPYEEYQVKTYDPRFFEMSVGTFDVSLRKISQRELDETKRLIQYLYFKDSTAVLNCRTCMLD